MSGQTILVTRPKGDEAAISDALHERGYRVIHEPLTEIFLLHTERQAVHQALIDEPDAVIVTSRHGIQALSLLTELRDPFIICVGSATADMAQSLGFTRVSAAGGNVQRLTDYVNSSYDEGSRFLYISGDYVRTDLTKLLPDMHVERIVAYKALASQQLSDTLVAQIRRGQVDAATFMSPRAAQIFTALLIKAGAEQSVENMEIFCLSDAVAEVFAQGCCNGVHVAPEATLASLVNCIDNVFK